MKVVEYEFEIDAPWELALLAYDRKSWSVPSPEFREVLRCDFDEWEVDMEASITKFRRCVQVMMPFPMWIMRVLTSDTSFWYEFRTTIDRPNRVLNVQGFNTTLQDLLSTTEHMTMKAHPENPAAKTILKYHSTWDIHSDSWVIPRFEALITRFYYKALKAGRKFDRRYIDKYRKSHGVNDVPLCRSEQNAQEIAKSRSAKLHIQPPDSGMMSLDPDDVISDRWTACKLLSIERLSVRDEVLITRV